MEIQSRAFQVMLILHEIENDSKPPFKPKQFTKYYNVTDTIQPSKEVVDKFMEEIKEDKSNYKRKTISDEQRTAIEKLITLKKPEKTQTSREVLAKRSFDHAKTDKFSWIGWGKIMKLCYIGEIFQK